MRDQAYTHMHIACTIAPFDDYYLVRLASLAVATGHVSEAIAVLQKAIILRPHNEAYQRLLAEAYRLDGRQDLYESLCRRLGRLDAYDEESVARRLAEWRLERTPRMSGL